MIPEGFDRSALAARRARISRKLGETPALLAAGGSRPRTYAGNPYAFRAGSHFLYLVGAQLEDGMLFHSGGEWTLFLEPLAADDALWHGPTVSHAELSETLGLPIRPRSELDALLVGRRVLTLPSTDPATNAQLSHLLGRPVQLNVLPEADGPLADAMIAARLIHDEAAIGEMRRAAEATCAAHLAGMRATRPGLLEAKVRAAMEAEFIARNLTTSYNPIVTVHGEVLHSHHHHHVMGPEDMLLADVGAESQGGFAADVTRTWPVSGKFSSTQRDVYQVVLAAEKAAVAAVRPGARYRDLHLLACRELAKGMVDLGVLRGDPEELVNDGVLMLLFPHGVGHIIGLDVHDMEDLGDRAGYAPGRTRAKQFGLKYLRLDRDLEPGMAVTIEPGIYFVPAILENEALTKSAGDRLVRSRLADFADVRGIRIEDDVLVTAEGHEVLSAGVPKDIADLEAQIGRA